MPKCAHKIPKFIKNSAKVHQKFDKKVLGRWAIISVSKIGGQYRSVPTDRRSFRTGPKKILEDRSVQDLKIAKRTSKDLFFDPGTIIRFFKMDFLEF